MPMCLISGGSTSNYEHHTTTTNNKTATSFSKATTTECKHHLLIMGDSHHHCAKRRFDWCAQPVVPFTLFGLFLLALLPTVTGARPVRHLAPRFKDTPNNITAIVGEDTVLPCSVEHLSTKSVVWKKVSDFNPIIIGTYVFSSDSRYSVHRTDPNPHASRFRPGKSDRFDHYHSGDYDEVNPWWNLQIQNVRMEDAGKYECQITTKDDVMRVVRLNVVHGKARRKLKKTSIKLTGTDFVEKGATIYLNCTATSMKFSPKGVDWFKDGTRIKKTGRIEEIHGEDEDPYVLHSRLEIHRSTMEDAGTYVCRFSQSHVESVKVIVLNTDSTYRRRGTNLEHIDPKNPSYRHPSFARDNNKSPRKSKEDKTSGCSPLSSHLHLWCVFSVLTVLVLLRKT